MPTTHAQASYDPRGLHRKLTTLAPHLFEGYEQQDVQERAPGPPDSSSAASAPELT